MEFQSSALVRYCLQDVLSAVQEHKDGAKILAEYEATNAILENKDLFVRIVVGLLVDRNCGSL